MAPRVVLLTADDHGTADIMRATGKTKTVIWRWQERFGEEGVAGLWRDRPWQVRGPLGLASQQRVTTPGSQLGQPGRSHTRLAEKAREL